MAGYCSLIVRNSMAYVTQTRLTYGDKYAVKTSSAAPWTQADIHEYYPSPRASQTTTSFRTGRGIDDLSTDKDFGSTNLEFRKTLKKDYDRGPQSKYDTGHTFDTTVQFLESGGDVSLHDVTSGARYIGPLFSDRSLHQQSTYPGTPATVSLGYYGPAAIKRCAPTSPHVSLSTALVELKREGLPSLPGLNLLKDKVAHFRELGGEYLNLEFGWKPIASDVQATIEAVRASGKMLEQFQRDSGKLVRRKTVFPEIRTTEIRSQPAMGRLYAPPGWSSTVFRNQFVNSSVTGTLYESTETVTRTWFSGAFTYFVQKDNDVLNQFRQFEAKVNHLYGLRITPDVLWNLAPWSWLSDWYVNIGDNIANASALANDGLVMKYGYLMQETTSTHRAQVSGPELKNGSGRGGWTTTFVTRRKVRTKATPYGFGSNPASFTSRQWAILSALGFARGTGQLSHGD
jgi:hypothetical protein